MNIIEAIASYPTDKKLKIGAASGYFYIGTIADYLERPFEISEELKRQVKAVADNREKKRSVIVKRDVSLNAYVSSHADARIEGYLDFILRWFDAVRKVSESAQTAMNHYSQFTPISQREVVSCQEADAAVDQECVNVIVDGPEHGAFYWTAEAAPGTVALGIGGKEG